MMKTGWRAPCRIVPLAFICALLHSGLISAIPNSTQFAAKSCQLLLAPTQTQYNEYFNQQILDFYHLRFRLSVLEQVDVFKKYSRDLQLIQSLAPLEYFYNFHFDVLSPRRIKFTHGMRQGARLFEKTFSQGIYQHPAGAKERGDLLRSLFAKMKGSSFFDPPYLDEILGLNRDALENQESQVFKNSKSEDKMRILSESSGIGLATNHDFWFSKHRKLFEELKMATSLKAQRVVDLGCGTGRLGLIAGFLFPEIKFIGLDLYPPRIKAAQDAAQRFGFENRIQFRVQDLLDKEQEIPAADYYYVFGPTNSRLLNNEIIDRLELIGKENNFYISSTLWLTTDLLKLRFWLHIMTPKKPHPSYLFANH